MAYNAGAYIKNYNKKYFEELRNIRERESVSRDVKARKNMEELKQERIKQDKPSPRGQVLVSRKMKHLPPMADYLKSQKPDV